MRWTQHPAAPAPLIVVSVLAIALALMSAGCVGMSLPEGATAEHRYFAAVADYTTAKVVATTYIAQPRTPLKQAETILKVAEDGDRYVHAVDAVRRGECSPEVVALLGRVNVDPADGCALVERDFDNAAGALRIASSILGKLAEVD